MISAIIDNYRRTKRKTRNCYSIDEVNPFYDRSEEIELDEIKDLVSFILKDHPDDTEQDKKDKEALIEVYLNEFPISEYAKHINLSRTTVYHMIRRCIDKTRTRYGDMVKCILQ
jgi:DNA-directed RNA polymerase specialized sigma24 family protein